MFIKQIVFIILLGIWLFICGIWDVKRKRIPVFLLIVGFLTSLVGIGLQCDFNIWTSLWGTSLGIILLLLNLTTKGQIGIGDGIIVSITGMYLGFTKNVILLMYGLFGAAICSMILLLFFQFSKKRTIPFVPFLFLGFLGVFFN